VDSSTNSLTVTKALETSGVVHTNKRSSPALFGLDSFAEMDFVSIDFVHSLQLEPCRQRSHNHHVPLIEAAGRTSVKVLGVYHLHCSITDRWGRQFDFTRPFVAIDRDPKDTPILLGRPALKDYQIVIFNSSSSWEFERKKKVKTVSSSRFQQLLQNSSYPIYEIRSCFRLPDMPETNNNSSEHLHRIEQIREEVNQKLNIYTSESDSDSGNDEPLPSHLSSIPKWLWTKYTDVFDQSAAKTLAPHRQTDHAIELKPNTEPPFMRTYNLSPRELEALDEFITERMEKGHIRESTSPAGAPILFIPKKNGTLRLCVDYRGLNAITIKNRYPIPLISELLDRLKGAKVFSKIDLTDAYYRIRIRQGDEWKTAFRTRYGHYEFLVMPMGLTNSPATFQSYVNNALRGYIDDFCVVYLDDILIFSANDKDHCQHLSQVMERLRQAELYANPKKCYFFRSEVEFLGFLVSEHGIRMDPERVKTITEWKKYPPQTFRDIQIFIGFCNFYRRFIYNFSHIVQPIQRLLHGMKNGRKPGLIGHEWQEPQQHAFERLIDCFTTAPILRHYDPRLPCRLETDASRAALAGVLSQRHKDGWHPIAFFSRKFSDSEWNYPIYDKEMLAIVKSFEHWRHYLDGAIGTEVYSDHQNLKDFMSQTRLNGRQTRWLIKLLPYDFRLFYRKGTLNPADGPSRRTDYLASAKEVDSTPTTHLLPALRSRLNQKEETKIESKSIGTAVESADKPNDRTRATHPAIASQIVNAIDTTAVSDASPITTTDIAVVRVEEIQKIEVQDLVPVMDQFEDLSTPVVEQPFDDLVLASDEVAKRDLATLRAQVLTRSSAEEVLSGVSQGAALTDDVLRKISEVQELDPFCTRIARMRLRPRRQHTHLQPFTGPVVDNCPALTGGSRGHKLLCVAGRVIVPEQTTLRAELLRLFHDCPSAGHWGEARTKELLQRSFWWPELGKDVREWISTCPQCQSKAVHTHRPYGELQPFIPENNDYRPFKHISLDWITGLPESRRRSTGEVFNSILTIVCRSTKAARFIPTCTDTSAADFARLFFENIECEYGTPISVVSDRDSRITSEFWTEICNYAIIKRRLSTAFHPQTDGQSEALNRIIENYLRAYCADEPTAWVNLLPLARFAYNNSLNAATKSTPNNLLYGMDCNIRLHLPENQHQERIPEARTRLEKLHELRRQLRDRLAEARERMTKYYNRNHVPKQFKKGQLVKLSARNFKFKHPKLAPRWLGPFRILERIGAQAYRLALPEKYQRVHNVFPIQFLEDYRMRDSDDNSFLPMPDLEDDDNEWEVQEIRDAKNFDGVLHYLVKWQGWPSEYDSWEPAIHLANAPQKIKEFERVTKRKQEKSELSMETPKQKKRQRRK